VGERELQHPLKVLEEGANEMRRALAVAPAALLFGSEKFGLSNEDLSHCHWLMRIPTRDAHISMNLGQAVAVCLYELVRSGAQIPMRDAPAMAGAAEVERLTQVLFQALRESGYVESVAEEAAMEKTRRMLRRLDLQGNDAVALTGMMRQILWKFRHPEKPE